jgi:hypothetical protein
MMLFRSVIQTLPDNKVFAFYFHSTIVCLFLPETGLYNTASYCWLSVRLRKHKWPLSNDNVVHNLI